MLTAPPGCAHCDSPGLLAQRTLEVLCVAAGACWLASPPGACVQRAHTRGPLHKPPEPHSDLGRGALSRSNRGGMEIATVTVTTMTITITLIAGLL